MATTFKVATLIIKTLVKPIANQLKKNAVNEGWFRDSCHWAGQVSNTVLTHIQLRSLGHKVKKIKPMPTDDAVKAGADLFAEAMVLITGMFVIGLEVIRKSVADSNAAEKKLLDELETKTKKELRQLDKEKQLREHLLSLEARMMDVENAKFLHLHEKLLYEQQKHLLVTENLLKRIHHLEHELKVDNIYPLLPDDIQRIPKPQSMSSSSSSSSPSSFPSTVPIVSPPTSSISAETLLNVKDLQLTNETASSPPKISEQTSQLFNYSTFHQLGSTLSSVLFGSPSPAEPVPPPPCIPSPNSTKPPSTTPCSISTTHQHQLEEDVLHSLLDTSLPTICASYPSSKICSLAPFAAASVLEDSDPQGSESSSTQSPPATTPSTTSTAHHPSVAPIVGKEHLMVPLHFEADHTTLH